MITTVTLDIPKKRLRHINNEIKQGKFRDLDDFMNKFVETMFDSFDANLILENRVNEAIAKGEKMPFPVVTCEEDEIRLLDEVTSEPVEVTNIREHIQGIYDRAIKRGAPREKRVV